MEIYRTLPPKQREPNKVRLSCVTHGRSRDLPPNQALDLGFPSTKKGRASASLRTRNLTPIRSQQVNMPYIPQLPTPAPSTNIPQPTLDLRSQFVQPVPAHSASPSHPPGLVPVSALPPPDSYQSGTGSASGTGPAPDESSDAMSISPPLAAAECPTIGGVIEASTPDPKDPNVSGSFPLPSVSTRLTRLTIPTVSEGISQKTSPKSLHENRPIAPLPRVSPAQQNKTPSITPSATPSPNISALPPATPSPSPGITAQSATQEQTARHDALAAALTSLRQHQMDPHSTLDLGAWARVLLPALPVYGIPDLPTLTLLHSGLTHLHQHLPMDPYLLNYSQDNAAMVRRMYEAGYRWYSLNEAWRAAHEAQAHIGNILQIFQSSGIDLDQMIDGELANECTVLK
ncbi:hypothetical protein BDN72DRAFT_865716 [Pluteus cervinus]|uniref:Uncharacterized protein n=1 Tax=Pluteus cervinus TaxID=181527 RepID=A0ACD2ZZ33_9AGAR|nr:hypothetical protein BDN72DRAFT_865716 [Pluteus cervinus]